MNIHLVALFHLEDLKKYGFDPILQPLVNDLKVLETQGIQVPFSDTPLRCISQLFSVIQVTGDNLAIHGLFGTVESFSATYCCPFCLTDKTSLQFVFNEDNPDLILCTKELYTEHCNAVAQNPTLVHSFGVKRTCPLNALQFFHCSDNYAVNIMHDLLEGVVQYELKLLFQYLVRDSICLNILSERIQSFKYGYSERKNRPSAIKVDDGRNDLGLNAIQSWCLLRNTPLIFGDLVDPDKLLACHSTFDSNCQHCVLPNHNRWYDYEKKHQNQLAFHWEKVYFKRFLFGPVMHVLTSDLEGSKVARSLSNTECV
ncbi:uncharacterized protein LOC118783083 isoform X1 [Megalops cyprinoides]|uniref:uncharacterized protein LOC118783083 isoform X1 n=1 Tax=Megalops cyprinoides TaxID=118141 RepID=UPI001863C085|nr:uncharacterized protein LOC118783083 isoform X1 [Megalops cyprinoides]XP_036392658.1 uncharacterized protein LOC118783083 isoform X1 [Megalops cyprinoides]XP_036392661.1 uncharacterized protein LOC118783083 isoform X1 [Megalops cyprinoides]XP_036392662.1 uncharacterized protein LOC118783083 isoform X1 [Megalops cyprinoides]XP_036392663.1 uncharacterized protein LOC118783083 isoform X1 [Megalops cyprinoides]XP_036392664.1 uncharacterized protein LOC118783083 isoform X1 [Megalops cyprinoides]